MFNRTYQLEQLATGQDCIFRYDPESFILPTDNNLMHNNEAGIDVETTFSAEFKMFMDQIEDAKKMIKTIDEGANSITKLMTLSHDVMTSSQSSSVSSNMNALIDRTNLVCTQCKNIITSLDQLKELGQSETENRMLTNSYNVVIKHFKNAMKRYQDAQDEFKKAISDRAKSQIKLIYPNMKDDEVDKIVEDTRGFQTVEQIAQSNFLENVSLRDAVSNIQGKYNDILALEQSMEQLKQMMVELAGVVSYQGELIDQIEHNTLKAVDYTGRVNQQLLKAKENKRKGGKLLTWFTIIVIIVGVSIMIPILLKIT
ncbi:syntaxin-like, putative [Theileria annulata]|uniref:Syntaxin-like, putative n=1 Tax=Theileria annulata TaxID=5874 RepID=Q4UDT3_THEAN|nr:syntaxin-like, putative [Theileria annulata]CAI74756.1 syntaxin-like, putative [Theileria annulata]|eukprot:XP_952488.1 syntaxin-like, putative [Theileria annulata]